MKMRNTMVKKRAGRAASRQSSRTEEISLPRMFLFLELFVEKDIPERSTK